MNQKKIERVARAICFSARTEGSERCLVCNSITQDNCVMIMQFINEAIAAIKEIQR
jgi:hypothetical protein